MKGLPVCSIPTRQYLAAQEQIRRRIEWILETHYPGHPWHVQVDLSPLKFMAEITHPLMPDDIAIRVKLEDEDPDGKIYVRLAGELLERCKIARGPLVNHDTIIIGEAAQAAAFSDIK